MTPDGNKAIALRFGQVWGKGTLTIVDELASPELRVSYPLMPAPTKGIAAFKEVLMPTRVGQALDGAISVGKELKA